MIVGIRALFDGGLPAMTVLEIVKLLAVKAETSGPELHRPLYLAPPEQPCCAELIPCKPFS